MTVCDHDWTTKDWDQSDPPAPFYEAGWVRFCRICGALDEGRLTMQTVQCPDCGNQVPVAGEHLCNPNAGLASREDKPLPLIERLRTDAEWYSVPPSFEDAAAMHETRDLLLEAAAALEDNPYTTNIEIPEHLKVAAAEANDQGHLSDFIDTEKGRGMVEGFIAGVKSERQRASLSSCAEPLPDALYHLRRIIKASDQFVKDTGLRHGDAITEAVDGARYFLRKHT